MVFISAIYEVKILLLMEERAKAMNKTDDKIEGNR